MNDLHIYINWYLGYNLNFIFSICVSNYLIMTDYKVIAANNHHHNVSNIHVNNPTDFAVLDPPAAPCPEGATEGRRPRVQQMLACAITTHYDSSRVGR